MSEAAPVAAPQPLVVGRYALFDELAAGGMATVHLGRLLGPVGFARTVAVKRLHSHFLKDQEFVAMFMDEARIVARIRHPNVVPMADVVQSEQGLFLIMEYVHGESLSRLMRTARKNGEGIPTRVVTAIMCGVLLGLHAAHETKGADGELLAVVHRDVSPQNIMVGFDGAARVLDFGIAKAAGRAQVTRDGQIKGKLAYMAPEQIRGQVDRRTDVFAAAVVLWEMLAGRRLHEGSKDVDIVTRVVKGQFSPPSEFAPALGPEIDAIVMRGLASKPEERFASARELALELERTVGLATASEVGEWVERLAKEVLHARGKLVSAMELASQGLLPVETSAAPTFVMPAKARVPSSVDVDVEVDEPLGSGSGPPGAAESSRPQLGARESRAGRARWRPPLGREAMVLLVSLTLAVVGIALGSSALARRSRRAHAAASPSAASVTPAMQTLTPPVTASPSAPAPHAAPSASAAAAAAPAPPAPQGERAAPAAQAGPSLRSPAAGAPAPRAAPARPKPQCEPPYTVDEIGHRHYKPECMGLD